MNPARFSVRRPIFTVMVVLIVIILGTVSFMRLPIDLMPDITYPTLSIRTSYENASPEEMEELITRPIEEAISAVPGVDEVTSTSAEGASDVRVSFTWGTDLDSAANDIRDRLDRVVPLLPEDAARPYLRKFDLASFPILILGAAADLDPVKMTRVIEDQVSYRLERIPGVASVQLGGERIRQIHLDLDAAKVKALGLQLDTILARVAAANVNQPGGTIDYGNMGISIRTKGEFTSLRQLGDTVIANRQDGKIRLRDVAKVKDTWQRVTRIFKVNGQPGVRLIIYKQSGANTVEAAEKVKAELKRIRHDLPQITLTKIIDTSTYIKRAVSNVGTSALYGGLLAIMVIFIFLGSLRSTLILATAIPVSIIATFGLMYFNHFTLNIMTLGGLALGVGMLVDNAIVVLENIFRLRASGQGRLAAAVNGTKEVGGAILASTLTTLTVFLPLIFVRGMAGVMFQQLSFVVSFALLCSLVVALTLVPMLAARAPGDRMPAEGKARKPRGLFRGLENSYKSLLDFSLRHRWLVVVFSLATLIATWPLVNLMTVELMPEADESEVRVYGDMEIGTRVEVLEKKFDQIMDIIRRNVPEMEASSAFLGGTPWRPSGTHTGQVRMTLVPQSQRKRSSVEIAMDLRRKLADIPGIEIRTRPGRGLFVLRMGFSGDDKIQMEIRGHDLTVADALAAEIKQMIEKIPGVADVQVSETTGAPESLILVDRIRAGDLGVSVRQVAETIQTVLAGTQAGNYRESGKEYPIVVKVAGADRMALDQLLSLTLTNRNGDPVALSNVVQVKPGRGPTRIRRKDQERVTTVSVENQGRPTSEVIADIRAGLSRIPLPQDFAVVFTGDLEEQEEAFSELMLSLVLALALVYMVMACQFESLKSPLVVMFSVPFAAIGVVLILFLTDTSFNVQSFIGCIMLGGIVVNNAILLVDHANLLRRRDGMPLQEAVAESGRRRLRPILMTALTTVLGLVPLALGLGEGGETQAPMARAVIGGLMSSTLITLVLVPTIYSLLAREKDIRPEEEEDF